MDMDPDLQALNADPTPDQESGSGKMVPIRPDPNPQFTRKKTRKNWFHPLPSLASANTAIMTTSLSSILVFLLSAFQQRLAYSI
jgi:hypothetical protein